MSTTTESDDESMGDAPTATDMPNQDTGSFTWTSCEDCDDKKRVAIKENAVAVGISQCKKLMKMFETSVPGSDGLNRPDILGREALQKWVGGCGKYYINWQHTRLTSILEDLIRRHRDFGVLVGVAGPTGSGKTSTLNALLGFNELLPTSNQEAATAVACKIAYNYDMRTNYKFRATVTFRTKMDLTKQLDLFFEDSEYTSFPVSARFGSTTSTSPGNDLQLLLSRHISRAEYPKYGITDSCCCSERKR